ncbi:ATP synthase subunit I, partial [Jatrophihabitans sp.]|uniref:ATP synthase subunit I n=1 Tax=Jatrophihabitans sp. TaxID=1932789 RepID=UPI0030C677C2
MNLPNSVPPPSRQTVPVMHSGLDVGSRAGGATAGDWDDEDPLPRRLTATEAEAFRDQRTAPSPWRVLLVQAEAGIVIALLLGLVFGWAAFWSALFGAGTAVVPGALMARGATRMADSRSPLTTAVGLLGWESAKIVCSMAMLVMAARVLHPVVWPALLVTLAGCLTVYWVALAWRAR